MHKIYDNAFDVGYLIGRQDAIKRLDNGHMTANYKPDIDNIDYPIDSEKKDIYIKGFYSGYNKGYDYTFNVIFNKKYPVLPTGYLWNL